MTTIEIPLKYTKTDEYIIPPHGFCPGCGVALGIRYFLKAIGDKVILVQPPGCTAPSVMRALIHNGKPIDNIGSPFGNTAMFAGGAKSALVAQGDTETIVATWSGDGATFDIGFGALSAAAERDDDILYVCNDNEAYQNTGNQRSSASPWMTINTTNPAGFPKMEFKKDIIYFGGQDFESNRKVIEVKSRLRNIMNMLLLGEIVAVSYWIWIVAVG